MFLSRVKNLVLPFCKKCGQLLFINKAADKLNRTVTCPNCGEINDLPSSNFLQTKTRIDHSPKDITRILEEGPPPIPKLLTQTFDDQKKNRCPHHNAIFKGFYQFSRGDEASRKYWWCPDCNQVFRYSGRSDYRPNKRIIKVKKE